MGDASSERLAPPLLDEGRRMCRAYFLGLNSRVFLSLLRCSTNADQLYAEAHVTAEREGMKVVGIEPCMLALDSAVRPVPEPAQN